MKGPRAAAVAAFLFAAAPAAAESGRTAAVFLQRTLGAQAAGMGNAFTAVRGRPDSLQFNPAAAATLERKTVTTTYLKGFGGTTHGFLGYAHPSRFGALSASLLYFNAGVINLNLSDGTRGQVTAEEDFAASFGYARRLGEAVYLGGNYRYVRMELAETAQATTSQGDFGVLVAPPQLRGLSAGAAYQYWGPDITFEEAGDPPPKTLRCGVAFRFPELEAKTLDPSVDLDAFDMTLAADWVKPLHEDASPRAGVEIGLTPALLQRLALRMGWVFERPAESLTLGMGFRQSRYSLDYSFGSSPKLNHLHQLTVSAEF